MIKILLGGSIFRLILTCKVTKCILIIQEISVVFLAKGFSRKFHIFAGFEGKINTHWHLMSEFIIRAEKKISLNLNEFWQFRELFYFFTWRDIKVKYKQTFIGFLWAILQPLLMMVVFTVFFGKVVNKDIESQVPYPLFVFAGLILWNVFSSGLSGAGNSMIVNANIIKKIYFPRLIIPISAILVSAKSLICNICFYKCKILIHHYFY